MRHLWDRRVVHRALILTTCSLIGLCLGLGWVTAGWAEEYGAESNPGGDPIGGGSGYSRIVDAASATHVVSTEADLRNALQTAVPGEVVYIQDEAEIDLTGQAEIDVPAGVTLASGRGRNISGQISQGALLYTTAPGTGGCSSPYSIPVVHVKGSNARVTGLRIQGYLWGTERIFENGVSTPQTSGIFVSYIPIYGSVIDDVEVDNCDISQFRHSGVYLCNLRHARIHHNNLHHNRGLGLGYGVTVTYAEALISENLMDYNRHSIAGAGWYDGSPARPDSPGDSYTACYNIHGGHDVGQTFDMHGGVDRGDGTNIAGEFISIHHNTFRAPVNKQAVRIRGVPQTGCWVNNNWFYDNKS